MDALVRWSSALQQWLLPWRCLLCGDRGAAGVDLCPDCIAELPRNISCCAHCALPLPIPAQQCGRCQRKPPPWDAAWAPFRYTWPLDRLETRFKFGRDLAAGRSLASVWKREPSPIALPPIIVPVPLHRRRLRERGYNQSSTTVGFHYVTLRGRK
ncbi:ComF family protein [Dyella mobilis]|uniref:ComF family protein n=1 Tax=Dyella mobilis TaxID=1849582 RepID=UPI0027B9B057|nr:double zinc ribbon domain-containing protein [Dyella mobilis]